MPRLAMLAAFALFVGCGAPSAVHRVTAPPHVRIVALPSGRDVSFDALVERLLEAKVIYVGEQHERPADHAAQRAILEALHAEDPSLAIGLEMAQAPHQDALDAFVAGELNEPTLLDRLEWTERWGVDFALYRAIFQFARTHRLPLVALNAPSELTRAVARAGLDALESEQRALLPELDLSDAAHRAMIESALREHPGMSPEMVDRFYAAQVVWDETMAARASDFLLREGAPSRLVVLAGAMHVRAGLGIPRRAARRGATPHVIVLPVTGDELANLRREHPPVADFLWVIPEPRVEACGNLGRNAPCGADLLEHGDPARR